MNLDTRDRRLQQMIDRWYAAQPSRLSARLGASSVGKECARELWYGFRHCSAPVRSGQLGRICETGDWYERRIVGWLRNVGLQVEAPEQQYEYTACDGHFVCRLDGAVLGVPGAEKTWHLLECKHANEKKFAKCAAQGVKKALPVYHAQLQVCMSLSGLDRALFVMANKNETWESDDIYTERVALDKVAAAALLERASSIINAVEPPARLREDGCRFCDHVSVCQQGAPVVRSCRTCAFVEVGPSGSWLCTVAASMRGLANGDGPEEYRADVLPCPAAALCPSYICLPCLDDGAEMRVWMREYEQ